MKVGELIQRLSEKQRKSVEGCIEKCGLLNPEDEIPTELRRDVVEFSKTISNPIRAAILKMLADRWLCVCLISEALGQDQTLISHHLRTLKRLGLVHERKEGKLHFYRTNREALRRYLTDLSRELLGDGCEAPEGR